MNIIGYFGDFIHLYVLKPMRQNIIIETAQPKSSSAMDIRKAKDFPFFNTYERQNIK